ncbi:unnamed protein product, partial [Rotaria sp. Silwood2]
MAVLLLFNKLSSWTVERMQDETQIKVDLFLQVLCGLLKSKLITCPEINNGELDKDLKETDIKMSYNIQIADLSFVSHRKFFFQVNIVGRL